jgi:hypothetical protein
MIPPKQSLSPTDASSISAITSRITVLQESATRWNTGYLWLVFVVAVFGAITFAAQYRANKLQVSLSEALQKLSAEKDRKLEVDLKDKDVKIADAGKAASDADKKAADARERAGKAEERSQRLEAENLATRAQVATLEQHAADASIKQKSVEIELEKQRARAAEAERLLTEVNERTRDRGIRPEVREALKIFLADAPKGTIRVTVSGGEPETRQFAKDIVAALRHAGWTVKDGSDDVSIMTPTPRGLLLRARRFSSSHTAIALRVAFSNIGFNLSPWNEENDDLDDAHFDLLVCPR